MKNIESKDNNKIKRLKNLNKKKVRDQENLFFIEGTKLLQEALASGVKVEELYVSDSYYQENMSFIDKIKGVDTYLVADNVFKTLSYLSNPEGVLGLGSQKTWNLSDILKEGRPLIILDRVNDPKNVGSIIRTGEAFSFSCVFALEGTADLYNEKTLRASMGSIFRMPNKRVSHEIFPILKEYGYEIYGLDLKGEDIRKAKLKRNCALVLGNESTGIDKDIKKYFTKSITIPMSGPTESLNVSNAASICIYEISFL